MYYKGAIIQGSGNSLVAIDINTKTVRWSVPTGFNGSNPTVDNGEVYANGMDQYLYAIDGLTGMVNWKYKYAKDQNAVIRSGPTYMNGVVYIADNDGNVFAVNAATGNLIWVANDPDSYGSGFYGNPCVADDILYIANYAGNVYAINVIAGSYKWRIARSPQILTSPTVANGIVYVSSEHDFFYALDAKTGKERWKYYVGAVFGSPYVSNGIVYIATVTPSQGGNIYAFNAVNGNLIWMYEDEDNFYSCPVVFNKVLYIASYNNVLAIGAAKGIVKWKYNTGDKQESFYSSPCVVDKEGNLFTSAESGNMN